MEQELRVRVLGGVELAVSGRPLVELASAKATALLVYLAVTGTGHSRSALAGLEEADQLGRQNVARMDVVRAQVAAARFHLPAAGQPTPGGRSGPPLASPARGPRSPPIPWKPTPASPRFAWPCWSGASPPVWTRPSCARPPPPHCAAMPAPSHGPAEGAGLPGLEALAPGPPWRRRPGLDAGHPGGRAGPRGPGSWPTPTTSSAATWLLASAPHSAWTGPGTSTGPGRPSKRSAAAPTRQDQPGPSAGIPERRPRPLAPIFAQRSPALASAARRV
jgi:hypothetical protein